MIVVCGTSSKGGIRSVIEAFESVGVYDGRPSLRLVTHKEGGKFLNIWVFLKAIFKLMRILLCNKNVIVHVHSAMKGSFFRKAILLRMSRLLGAKTVFHLHGSEFKVFYRSLWPILQSFVQNTLNKCDQVVVLSSSWQGFITSICAAKVIVIPNFVDDEYGDLDVDNIKQKHKLCFLGEVGERKGAYDLLKAVAEVKAKGFDFKLSIAGNGNLEKAEAVIKELNLSDYVQLLGWIGPVDRKRLLTISEVMVLPSYNEGLPMSIIEALSASCVVVSTNVGGIPELLESCGDGGVVIEPGDTQALSDAIISLLEKNSAALKCSMIKNRAIYLERHSPPKVKPLLTNLYTSLSG
jgi:glycosyltransferase involved in cell wall biosynthesis